MIDGLNNYKTHHKSSDTISGQSDENLPNKIADIELQQKIAKCCWDITFKCLTTKGLTDAAKERFRNKARDNPENVNA